MEYRLTASVNEDFFFTVKQEKKDFCQSENMEEVKHIFKPSGKGIYKLQVQVIFEGESEAVFYPHAKALMLELTGTYDRLVPLNVVKAYINANLLPGKKAIKHFYRITFNNEPIEF